MKCDTCECRPICHKFAVAAESKECKSYIPDPGLALAGAMMAGLDKINKAIQPKAPPALQRGGGHGETVRIKPTPPMITAEQQEVVNRVIQKIQDHLAVGDWAKWIEETVDDQIECEMQEAP